MDLFSSKEKRKEKDGKIVLPEKTKAKPRILEWYFPNLAKESFLFVDFINKMRENKLEV